MGSKYVKCRDFQHDEACTTTLVADNDVDLMEAVVKHAINVHGLANTGTFRNRASAQFKEGTPPT